MVIYFAGSIRGGRADQAIYLEIIEVLRRHGTVLTEHIGAEALSGVGEPLPDCDIHDRDLDWLRQADVLVAEVTTPSLGVGYEIGRAVEWGKRIVCLYRPMEGRRLSGMIAGCGSVSVHEYATAAELPEILDRVLRPPGTSPRHQAR
jgi:2'-deoxynucleoside 5'-phosphate N-hydrolase